MKNNEDYKMLSKFNQSLPMMEVRGGDGKTFVTYLGSIKDEFGNDIKYELNDLGERLVDIKYLNIKKIYRVIDVVCGHFKDFEHLGFDVLNKIIAFQIDGNVNNLHAGNLGYRFEGGYFSLPERKDFRLIPGFPRRAINKSGELISTITNESLKWYITKPQLMKNITGGYYTNRVEISGKAMTLLRHRAILLTFKDYPNDVDKLISNHIDGIPGNDDINNLEWVDHRGNLEHSYKNNLRTQNKPVTARNIFTGEEKTYFSVAECGRDLNINDRTINFKLEKSKFSSICRQGYQFKYLDDSRDWIIPTDPEEAIEEAIQAISLVVVTPTGLRKECRSLGMASIVTGFSRYRISKALRNNEILNGFKFEALD